MNAFWGDLNNQKCKYDATARQLATARAGL